MRPVLVLALDTSTPAVTAGICALSGEAGSPEVRTLAERVTVDARAHAELLTPHLSSCLDDAGLTAADLDAVVVGCGPGPFTGLRVGMATAAAFGDALDLPVHGVCSLDALAARAVAAGLTRDADGDLLVVTDARRREAYHSRHRAADGMRLSGPEVSAASAVDVTGVAIACGDPVRLAELPAGPGHADGPAAPDAAGLVRAGATALLDGRAPEPLEPLYLRRPDAVPPRPATLSSALRGAGGTA